MATGDFAVFDEWPIEMQAVAHPTSNTWKLAIITTSTTPAETDADPHFGGTGTTDLSTNEVSAGGNYTAGGLTLTSVTFTESGGTATFDSANVTMAQNASNPNNGRWGVLYDDTDANKKALGFYDFGAVRDFTTGALTLTTSTGWFTTTTA